MGTTWTPTLEGTYRDLAPAVLGYFRSHGAQAAEDLVSEVFVGVARNLHRFRGDPEDLSRWVFTIARRRRVDHIRQGVRRLVSAGRPPDRSVFDQPENFDSTSRRPFRT